MKPLNLDSGAAWKQRFRAPKIRWSEVAVQQPTRGATLTNRSGVFQLYAWDVPSGELRQLTNLPTGLRKGHIAADGRFVYYHLDKEGNEIGHYVRVPFEGGEPEDITPDLPLYASNSLTDSHDGSTLGFMVAGAEGFQAFCLRGGQRSLLFQSRALSSGPVLSSGGETAVIATTERTGQYAFSLVALDVATGQRIGELLDQDASIQPASFAPLPGDARLLASTDHSGYNYPFIWNARTGERQALTLPALEGEIYPWGWSPDAREVLLCQLHQARYQLYRYDLASGRLVKLNHPQGSFGSAYYVPGGDIFADFMNAAEPPCLIALDGETGEQKRVVLKAGEVPAGRPWKSVTFPSTGGVTVQGWLGLPEGQGPFPTILTTHGGPTGVQTEAYDAILQAWLDHGFAVLSINYRGSTTFGKAFERAIWGQLGTVEVEDMAAAHDWLVANHIAQPGAILLTGGSYGGYLTLQALGRRPDLWAGGMAMVAIADWTLMYEDEAETLKGYQKSIFGGTPQEKAEAYRVGSPITYAEDIRAPILVIQGSNDTRCPERQMRTYEAKLKSLGKSIEVYWFEAGHGSLAVEESIKQQELMLRFAYRVLG